MSNAILVSLIAIDIVQPYVIESKSIKYNNGLLFKWGIGGCINVETFSYIDK